MNESSRSNLKEYEDVSSQDLLRHHEDSGIDMSPIKKDDNLEGDEFLERARKVSLGSRYFFDDRQRKFIDCSRKCNCDHRSLIRFSRCKFHESNGHVIGQLNFSFVIS